MKTKYVVFNYTDNIFASADTYNTKKEAKEFITQFRKRFDNQGYYKTNNWDKINPRDELEKEYNDWFFNLYIDKHSVCKTMSNDEMIEELIADELEYRKDDSVEDLKETIEYIKNLSRI